MKKKIIITLTVAIAVCAGLTFGSQNSYAAQDYSKFLTANFWEGEYDKKRDAYTDVLFYQLTAKKMQAIINYSTLDSKDYSININKKIKMKNDKCVVKIKHKNKKKTTIYFNFKKYKEKTTSDHVFREGLKVKIKSNHKAWKNATKKKYENFSEVDRM